MVEDVILIAGEPLGPYLKFARQVVEAGDMQADPAQTGQIPLAWGICGSSEKGAVHRHCLGGVLDAVGGAQPGFQPQRVGWVQMTAGQTLNVMRRPLDHPIEQAHPSLMRDMGGDPVVV